MSSSSSSSLSLVSSSFVYFNFFSFAFLSFYFLPRISPTFYTSSKISHNEHIFSFCLPVTQRSYTHTHTHTHTHTQKKKKKIYIYTFRFKMFRVLTVSCLSIFFLFLSILHFSSFSSFIFSLIPPLLSFLVARPSTSLNHFIKSVAFSVNYHHYRDRTSGRRVERGSGDVRVSGGREGGK